MKTLFLAALIALPAPLLAAEDHAAAMNEYYMAKIAPWAQDAALIAAITAQNATTGAYDQAKIDALDAQWQAEVGTAGSALIDGVVKNAAADLLRQRIEASGGELTEAFITDARGLNVAASATTSDYWQGDEDKFTKVFPAPDGKFFSEIEIDESTQIYQAQISVTITDPATGAAIGTLTVAVDAEALL